MGQRAGMLGHIRKTDCLLSYSIFNYIQCCVLVSHCVDVALVYHVCPCVTWLWYSPDPTRDRITRESIDELTGDQTSRQTTEYFYSFFAFLNTELLSSQIMLSSDHSFKSEPSPISADACGEVTGCTVGCREVGMCSTRSESQGTYNVRLLLSANKAEPHSGFETQRRHH